MYAMNEGKFSRIEQAALDRRLGRYVGFQCGSQSPVEPPVTTPGAYVPPRLVSSREYVRRPRLGGRELFAWALAGSLALTNFAGGIAWLTR